MHEIPHDEEVRRESHRLHDVELVLDALEHVRCRRLAVALARTLHRELAEIRVFVVPLGNRERRQHGLPELDLDLRPLRDQQGVVARVGQLAEHVTHLRGRLDVEVVALEFQPLGVTLERAGLHTEQRVVSLGVFLVRVVAVVRREQGRLEAARDVEERANDPNVVLETVVLELDEEVIAPEDVLEARRGFEGSLLVAGEDQLRDQPTQAPTRGGDALVMTFEQLPVAARLVVVAVEIRGARDLDEVPVALVGLREHRQMEDLVLGALRAVEPGRVGEVTLHADHGLHAGGARGGVHRERAVHVPVVSDADRGLPVGRDRGDDIADARRAVEHRVFGVQMQMDERVALAHRAGWAPLHVSR